MWKVAVVVVAVAGIVSTPLVWLLNSPDTGQLVGASIQGAVAVAALVWALFQQPQQPPAPTAADVVMDTGEARATRGGWASTGVRRPGGARGGTARAQRTGQATAQGPGSSASTGIDYS
jgi:hypothetical protein